MGSAPFRPAPDALAVEEQLVALVGADMDADDRALLQEEFPFVGRDNRRRGRVRVADPAAWPASTVPVGVGVALPEGQIVEDGFHAFSFCCVSRYSTRLASPKSSLFLFAPQASQKKGSSDSSGTDAAFSLFGSLVIATPGSAEILKITAGDLESCRTNQREGSRYCWRNLFSGSRMTQ